MKTKSNTTRALAVLLFLAIAITAWLLVHEAMSAVSGASHHDVVFNPGFQHSQRMEAATARAAMDALGMAGTGQAMYQADYRLQRMQIQADSIGLERWAAQDVRRQGLLREIRASMAGFLTALDQTTGSAKALAGGPTIPLLPALNRVQTALSNYAASLTEPAHPATAPFLFSRPVLLWWLLILLLLEAAALAWLVFSAPGQV